MHSSAQGPLSTPNWIAHHARIFPCVPPTTLLSSDGQMKTRCSHPPRTAILAARDMATSNAQLETTLTASAQLFATPHGASQFRVVRERVKARPRADRYRRGKSLQAPGTAPKRGRRDVFLSRGVWKSIRDDANQLKEPGRRGRSV